MPSTATRRTVFAASLAALALAPVAPLHTQQPGITAVPDTAVERIDRAFAALGNADAPGCAVGMSRNGQPVLTRAYGMANLEHGVRNTPETIFETGSVAKQFTAAALLLLAQDGRLSLDDDVRRYLPEVPDFGHRITIRHLLTHTSGLRDQWGLLGLKGSGLGTQVHDFDTILSLVSRQQALNFRPGAEHVYSNTGYTLAAIIVQRVSGRTFATFSNERLFTPLGMTNTRWRDDFTAVVRNRATAYSGTVDTGFRQDMPFTNVIGSGGLLTTVTDLLKWNAFLDSSVTTVGNPGFTQQMERRMTFNDGRRSGYALGLFVGERDRIREVTHGGATAGYRTWLARFPAHGLSIAVLCNSARANASALGGQAIATLLPRPAISLATTASGTSSDAQLAPYAGLFRARRTETLMRAAVRDGWLTAELPARTTLMPTGPDRFRAGTQEIVYRRDDGHVREVLRVSDGDTTRYLPARAVTPTAAALAAYAGSYWSDELETRIRVLLRDGAIVVQRPRGREVPLAPTFADGFTGDLGNVVFSRNRAGRVDGFAIWEGRVRNVRFAREPVTHTSTR